MSQGVSDTNADCGTDSKCLKYVEAFIGRSLSPLEMTYVVMLKNKVCRDLYPGALDIHEIAQPAISLESLSSVPKGNIF